MQTNQIAAGIIQTGGPYRPVPQEVVDALIVSGSWLIWSATVIDPEHPDNWTFIDLSPSLPTWCDIERRSGETHGISLFRARIAEDDAALYERCSHALRTGDSGYRSTYRIRLRGGGLGWVEEAVTIRQEPDGTRRLIGVCIDAADRMLTEDRIISLQDDLETAHSTMAVQDEQLQAMRERLETERESAARENERLVSLAASDELTGLMNRRAFLDQIEREWHAAKRYQRSLSVILMDLDRFHQYNADYGYIEGDDAIKRIADVLRRSVRQCDAIARYGGEQFIILLPYTELPGAMTLAERFRACLESETWWNGTLTASFGVTTYGPDAATPQSLIDEADRAVFQAKTDGRNCVRSSDMVAFAMTELVPVAPPSQLPYRS